MGRSFLFESADAARLQVELELLEVTRQNAGGRPSGFREPFSLLFALRSSKPLASGLHSITHDDFEAAGWFLTRVLVPGRDPRLAYYEAVFG